MSWWKCMNILVVEFWHTLLRSHLQHLHLSQQCPQHPSHQYYYPQLSVQVKRLALHLPLLPVLQRWIHLLSKSKFWKLSCGGPWNRLIVLIHSILVTTSHSLWKKCFLLMKLLQNLLVGKQKWCIWFVMASLHICEHVLQTNLEISNMF